MLLLELPHRNSNLLANNEDRIFSSQTTTPTMLLVDIDQIDGRRVILQQTKAWTATNSSRNMELEVALAGFLLSCECTMEIAISRSADMKSSKERGWGRTH